MNQAVPAPVTPLHLTLIEPQIPQNTGSIARLCVGLGARLHLIRPLGFALHTSRVKRAALDYWAHADIVIHPNWDAYLEATQPAALHLLSTRGTRSHFACRFRPGAHIVFGNESSGFPPDFYTRYGDWLFRIPMPGPHARSLNLANAASVVAYEAYRQFADNGANAPDDTIAN